MISVAMVMKEIQRAQWSGPTPIGPLGAYVELKDFTYKDVLRVQIGGSLSAFVVANVSDKRILQDLLRHYNQ